jgi:hypothetical protein
LFQGLAFEPNRGQITSERVLAIGILTAARRSSDRFERTTQTIWRLPGEFFPPIWRLTVAEP